jgi:hypothetical protein
MAEIIYKDESFQIVGACFEVYNDMGCGFHEQVYQVLTRNGLHRRSAMISEHNPFVKFVSFVDF